MDGGGGGGGIHAMLGCSRMTGGGERGMRGWGGERVALLYLHVFVAKPSRGSPCTWATKKWERSASWSNINKDGPSSYYSTKNMEQTGRLACVAAPQACEGREPTASAMT